MLQINLMMKNKELYFNAPIQLYSGFMVDKISCLNNVSRHARYYHATKKLIDGVALERFKAACKYFDIQFVGGSVYDITKAMNEGQKLFETIPENSPKVGISCKVFWKYYNEEKSDFEKICLLGFLAIKSTINTKPYFKINNNLWLGRMDGETKPVSNIYHLSPQLFKYANEYQLGKIKKELRSNWGLIDYGVNVRGFYVSFQLSLEQLVYEAEKNRKSNKENEHRANVKEAIRQAKIKLNNSA